MLRSVVLVLCLASAGGVARAQIDDPPDAPTPSADADGSSDERLAARLDAVFDAVDEFERVDVDVESGVARLSGEVPNGDARERAVELAGRIDGVIYVDDRMAEPFAVSDRLTPMRERAEGWVTATLQKLPLIGVALVALLALIGLGRLASRDWRLYRIAIRNALLRTLVKRMILIAFGIVGLLVALEILDATTVVGTVLGAAGVLGLAVGFAFRDIVENYLASFLLAVRRPFAPGDAVKIGEHEGKVIRLTMRETVLMSFEGNHLTLPNATVFKAPVLNYTRNPKRRFDFAVGAGVDTDLIAARKLGVETLAGTPGTLADPAPTMVIEQLGDSNVALRFYAWMDQSASDFLKTRSEAIRRVKTAMENAGVDMPEPIYRVHLVEPRSAPSKPAPNPIDHPDADVVAVDHAVDEQIAELEDPDEANLLQPAGPRA
ncbi:MAG: mechanosensitive ion channel family protein [Sandaracinaceae bacterium]